MILLEIVTRLFSILWWVIEFVCPLKIIVIDEGELGAVFVCGVPSKELTCDNGLFGTGLHFATSGMRLEKAGVLGHVVELDGVNVFTQDGAPMTVTAMITYDIVDYRKYIRQSDLNSRVKEIATADIMEMFSSLVLELATTSMIAVEAELQEAIQTNVDQLGVRLSSRPRINGRGIDEECVQRAFLIPVMESILNVEFSQHERAAIIAGSMLSLNAGNAVEEEEDLDEEEEDYEVES